MIKNTPPPHIQLAILLIAVCFLFFACDNPFIIAITDPMFGFIVESPDDWCRALEAIRNGGNGGRTTKDYTITVKGTVYVESVPQGSDFPNTFGDVKNIKVTLRGKGTLRLNSAGHLLKIEENQTLVINGPTLQGMEHNYQLIKVSGTLELNNGSITGNIAGNEGTSIPGGGVYIYNGGIFIMNGGTISNNFANGGGGVYIEGVNDYSSIAGTFIMNGGIISGNTATGNGGGVEANGIFSMNGGIITGNKAKQGGGVVVNGSFTYGGSIYGNTADEEKDNDIYIKS